ncbi:MAG: sensor domain-containing diguanylate cyclase [Pseudomonadales bacterium]|nr:sensor domain-containing diguanylate cyclase [Pseudomonadales bacterium]
MLSSPLHYFIEITLFGLVLALLIIGYRFFIQLKRREEQYRHLFNHAEVCIWNEDFSEVYRHLQKLKRQGVDNLQLHLQKHPELVIELIAKVKVLQVNRASLTLFSATSEAQLINSLQSVFGPGATDIFIQELCAIWDKKSLFKAEVSHLTLAGNALTVIISMPIPNTESGFKSIPVSLIDITERKKTEQLVWQQANFDALTQLANRNLLFDRIKQEILKDERASISFALVFIDLDGFKKINDVYGHHIGDVLLIETARRIKNCVRESDTVGRFGGDEFCIILSSVSKKQDIKHIAAKLNTALSDDFMINQQALSISASIGITLFPDDSTSFNQLFKYADQAMYSAKNAGGNDYAFYDQLGDAKPYPQPITKNIKLSN